MENERNRIDRAGDQVDTGSGRFDRGCERAPPGPLAVEADGKATLLANRLDQLADSVRLEGAGRVVHQHSCSAQLGEPLRLRDERVRLAGRARAVDETRVELTLGGGDRLARLAQVRDVVERIVQPEDVDAALGGRGDEAPHEVRSDRPRADQEAAAQRERKRRRRPGAKRADPLPGALDPALHGGVEAATAGDLEVREACRVEELGETQLRRGRHDAGEGLLPEQPDGRVDERRHERSLPPARPRERSSLWMQCHRIVTAQCQAPAVDEPLLIRHRSSARH